jgi:hypothetical protein
VQIAETCSPENEVQLITAAIAQTAARDDHGAMAPVLAQLKSHGLLPDLLYADSHYGGDPSEQVCAGHGVDLQAPLGGPAPVRDEMALTVDDFVMDEAGEKVECCPAGHVPLSSVYDQALGRTRTEMPAAACSACADRKLCPVRHAHRRYLFDHTPAERRVAERRREQETQAFQEHYRIRAGIESTNGGLKRRVGLKRLRCRGRPKVFHTIYLKLCGWNILRASATKTLRTLVAQIMRKLGLGPSVSAFLRHIALLSAFPSRSHRLPSRFPPRSTRPPLLRAA